LTSIRNSATEQTRYPIKHLVRGPTFTNRGPSPENESEGTKAGQPDVAPPPHHLPEAAHPDGQLSPQPDGQEHWQPVGQLPWQESAQLWQPGSHPKIHKPSMPSASMVSGNLRPESLSTSICVHLHAKLRNRDNYPSDETSRQRASLDERRSVTSELIRECKGGATGCCPS
jgi:hypothetical protein